jgi:hypothetical protein
MRSNWMKRRVNFVALVFLIGTISGEVEDGKRIQKFILTNGNAPRRP